MLLNLYKFGVYLCVLRKIYVPDFEHCLLPCYRHKTCCLIDRSHVGTWVTVISLHGLLLETFSHYLHFSIQI